MGVTAFCQRLTVLLLLTAVVNDAANPLSKFMMMNKNNKPATSEDDNSCDEALHQAADALKAAERASETATKDKEAALSKVQKLQTMMDEMRTDFDARIKKLSEKQLPDSKEVQEAFEVRSQELQASHDQYVAEVRSLAVTKEEELAGVIASLKEQLQAETERIEKVKTKYMKLMDKGIKETEEKWKTGLAGIESQSKMYLSQIDEENKAKCKREKETLGKEHAEAMAALEGEKAELMQQIDGLEKDLTELKESSARQLQVMSEQHETVVNELKAELDKEASARARLDSENSDLRLDLSIWKKEVERMNKELEHWEDLYARRPYCNVTHMREDFSKVFNTATRATTKKLSEAKEKVSSTVAPMTKGVSDALSEKVISPVAQTTGAASDAVFSKCTSFIRDNCPSHLSTLKDMKEDRGIAIPDSLISSLQHSCDNPDKTVSTMFKATLVLVGLLFLGPLSSLLLRIWRRLFSRPPAAEDQRNGKAKGRSGRRKVHAD